MCCIILSLCVNRAPNQRISLENFISTILFMLNLVKKSFQIELNDFFKLVGSKGESIGKQGFSEARKKAQTIRQEAAHSNIGKK
ncbi:hypothetical protein SAMN05192533_10844 [Mesobacillus persicus]|uniref:Uncharacterized protein n=1 Tax=Mesobacillus persicus TaxID=930146 RepID=A0A1H8D418_9BACI|nr:hypothetical protein SAMN05192533_10844 [Mesobacillus persicus]